MLGHKYILLLALLVGCTQGNAGVVAPVASAPTWHWLAEPVFLYGWTTTGAWTTDEVEGYLTEGAVDGPYYIIPDGTTMVIIEVLNRHTTLGKLGGVRSAGLGAAGTDDTEYVININGWMDKVVAVNTSKQCQYYKVDTNIQFFLLAYAVGPQQAMNDSTWVNVLQKATDTTAAWDESHLDFSADAQIPDNATGVGLRLLNLDAAGQIFTVRRSDSTDNDITRVYVPRPAAGTSYTWGFVGLAATAADEYAADVDVDAGAVNYFDGSTRWLQNPSADAGITLVTAGAWDEASVPAVIPSEANALCVHCRNLSTTLHYGIERRQDGGCFDYHTGVSYGYSLRAQVHNWFWVPIGLYTGQIELLLGSTTNLDCDVWGYTKGPRQLGHNFCDIKTGIPDYGAEKYFEFGDSIMKQYYTEFCQSISGVVSLKLNSWVKNDAVGSTRLLTEEIRNQYRDGCCSGGNNCPAGNTCTYDWLLMDGGINDIHVNDANCTDAGGACPASCDAVLDLMCNTTANTGAIYDILSDISYQGSGTKKVALLAYYDIGPSAAAIGHLKCIQALNDRYTALAAEPVGDHSNISVYVLDAESMFTHTTHPEYYEADDTHPSLWGSDFLGEQFANLILTH